MSDWHLCQTSNLCVSVTHLILKQKMPLNNTNTFSAVYKDGFKSH